MENKISVIVPVYNIENYLDKCIQSILKQSYPNLEIILVDDGSTDTSFYICEKYKQLDNRVIVLHKQNGGLVSARKAGLEIASGDYITFVDGDDWIESDMYLNMIQAIIKTNSDFVDTGYVYEKNNVILRRFHLTEGEFFLNEKTRHFFYERLLSIKKDKYKLTPSIWSKLFKRELILETYKNVPNNKQHGEDVINLIYCLNNANKLCQLDKEYYHYVYREDSIMNKQSVKAIKEEISLWNYCLELIEKFDACMSKDDCDKVFLNKMLDAWNHIWGSTENWLPFYKFPDQTLFLGKKIVVYGAGAVGRDYFLQFSTCCDCEVVSWIDKNYSQLKKQYIKLAPVSVLETKEFDNVIIGVLNEEMADEIRNELLEYQIPIQKIVWEKPITRVEDLLK